MKNSCRCIYNEGFQRKKIREHQFKERAGFSDYHHLRPRHGGGQSIASNLLKLDAYRHDAWHLFFKNMTLNETINLISRKNFKNIQAIIASFSNKVGIDECMNNAWFLLFGDQSIEKIIRLLIRVKRIKRYQSLKFATQKSAA